MWARAGLVLGFLLVWLIVLMPLKAVVMLAGPAGYSDVYGTVWDGRIYDLRLQGQTVRETRIRLRPAGLLTGRLSLDWQVEDDSLRGRGRTDWGHGGVRLTGTDFSVALDRVDAPDLPGLGGDERVQGRISELDWRNGTCRAAAGEVRTGALTGFDGPVLTGQLACRDGVLVVDFAGRSDRLELDGEAVFGAQAVDWRVTARTEISDMADMLALAGFERDGDVWQREGRRAYDGNP